MIGPNRWRLLVVYAACSIISSWADEVRIESSQPSGGSGTSSVRTAKNLLPPFQPFSIVDNLRYTVDQSRSRNPKTHQEFGSFRFISRDDDSADSNRRSDNVTVNNLVAVSQSPPVVFPENGTATMPPATTSHHHVVEIVESIDLTDSARRTGYTESTFVPQGYSEDQGFGDSSLIRRPFFDNHHEFMPDDTSNEHMRLVEFFGGLANPNRNQIETAESAIQPIRLLPPLPSDQMATESQRLRAAGSSSSTGYPTTIYYQNNNDYRSRHYFPPKPEFFGEYSVIKKFPSTWKSRTPRVIFPIPDLSAPGPPYSSDGVVFK